MKVIFKKTETSLTKENSKIFHNDTTDNQCNSIELELLYFVPLTDTSTMRQLKGYRKYISNNYFDTLNDNFLKINEDKRGQ